MEFEYIKSEVNEEKYSVTDIVSLRNPFRVKNYMLVNHINGNIGAVNLQSGVIEYLIESEKGFNAVVDLILDESDWNEWVLIKSENATLTLDCKDGTMEQRISSELF